MRFIILTLYIHTSLAFIMYTSPEMSLAFISLLLLSILHLSSAQNNPQDYVNAHNAARRQVGVGPIQWDQRLANYARNYASKLRGTCRLVHSGGPYGENLAGSSADLPGTAAVQMWVNEKSKYNYNTNSCVGGECRHYTQVVWRNSVRLGCAKVRCNNGGSVISCNYDPPGNYVNQKPYLMAIQEVTSSA